MERNRIMNIIMIIIGVLVLCTTYVIACHMDLGNPTVTFKTTFSVQNTVQKPMALYIGILASLALLGAFLIIYPAICLRKGIGCIDFR